LILFTWIPLLTESIWLLACKCFLKETGVYFPKRYFLWATREKKVI
jgi:hypothetical protein